MYRNPEEAIEYSFKLIDMNDDKKIHKTVYQVYYLQLKKN